MSQYYVAFRQPCLFCIVCEKWKYMHDIASFPGPTQLSVTCSGNEAMHDVHF